GSIIFSGVSFLYFICIHGTSSVVCHQKNRIQKKNVFRVNYYGGRGFNFYTTRRSQNLLYVFNRYFCLTCWDDLNANRIKPLYYYFRNYRKRSKAYCHYGYS